MVYDWHETDSETKPKKQVFVYDNIISLFRQSNNYDCNEAMECNIFGLNKNKKKV